MRSGAKLEVIATIYFHLYDVFYNLLDISISHDSSEKRRFFVYIIPKTLSSHSLGLDYPIQALRSGH